MEYRKNGIEIRPKEGDTLAVGFMTRFEGAGSLLEKTLTASALVDGKLYTGSGVLPEFIVRFEHTDTHIQIALNEPGSDIARFQFYISEPHLFQAAKLELGPVQTLARQNAEGAWELIDPLPDPALELAKCQRYLQVLMYGGYDEAHSGIGSVLGTNNKARIQVPFQLKLPMRANPTLITGHMQVNKTRIVGRSLSTYLPDWSAFVEAMTAYTATKNQLIAMCELPDTATLAENYTYELDALFCPQGEVLLASAEL